MCVPIGSIRSFNSTSYRCSINRVFAYYLVYRDDCFGYEENEALIPYLEQAGTTALDLNFSTMLIGFISAKVFSLNFKQSLTISIESGLQNGTMAIARAV